VPIRYEADAPPEYPARFARETLGLDRYAISNRRRILASLGQATIQKNRILLPPDVITVSAKSGSTHRATSSLKRQHPTPILQPHVQHLPGYVMPRADPGSTRHAKPYLNRQSQTITGNQAYSHARYASLPFTQTRTCHDSCLKPRITPSAPVYGRSSSPNGNQRSVSNAPPLPILQTPIQRTDSGYVMPSRRTSGRHAKPSSSCAQPLFVMHRHISRDPNTPASSCRLREKRAAVTPTPRCGKAHGQLSDAASCPDRYASNQDTSPPFHRSP